MGCIFTCRVEIGHTGLSESTLLWSTQISKGCGSVVHWFKCQSNSWIQKQINELIYKVNISSFKNIDICGLLIKWHCYYIFIRILDVWTQIGKCIIFHIYLVYFSISKCMCTTSGLNIKFRELQRSITCCKNLQEWSSDFDANRANASGMYWPLLYPWIV